MNNTLFWAWCVTVAIIATAVHSMMLEAEFSRQLDEMNAIITTLEESCYE